LTAPFGVLVFNFGIQAYNIGLKGVAHDFAGSISDYLLLPELLASFGGLG
jgi:hypothetical protein